MSKVRIGVIIGSTRPGRKGDQVARWVVEKGQARGDAEFELVDVAEFGLPLLDEPMPASMGQYQNEHTKRWAEKIGSLDGFVFVTPEYNHKPSGAILNALDFVYGEWNDKAAGIVSYGASANGQRAAEVLRLVLGELQVADVRQSVAISLMHDFENFATFTPGPQLEQSLSTMFDQLVSWATALREVRAQKAARAA